MKHWQPGLLSYDPVRGEAGQPGAQMLLRYKMGKREVEMIETIIIRDFPYEFSGTYEAKGVWNEVKNTFVETAEGTTVWQTENTFRFKGFMKLMAALMPAAFKKQSFRYMEYFKAFAERS